MADYISTLTGVQMDSALIDMAEHTSEAYAVGERNGVPVDSSDVTYHNNARYYASQAQSIAPASVTEAVRWDVAQTALTDANKLQARSNIDAGKNGAWTNPNLLDNPWFTVNQRSLSTYALTAFAYCVDRWKSSGGNTITVGTNGISITAGTGTHQNFAQGSPIIGDLLGRTVTASVMSQTGEISSVTFTLPSSIGSGSLYDGGSVTVDGTGLKVYIANSYSGLPSGYTFWLYSSSTAQTVTYRAAKLELGSVSTLANDAPPNYAEELAKCMRYFTRLTAYNNENFGFGYAIAGTIGVIHLLLPTPMRATPTVSTNGSFNLIGAGASRTVTAIGTPARGVNGIQVQVTSSSLTVSQAYMLVSAANGTYIDLSADL